jgi:Fe-S cluster assembly protein SufD
MTLKENFKKHSDYYIFSHDKFLLKEREKTFNKIYLSKFDKKNNESLKNISLSELNSFNYYFQPAKEKPIVRLVDKNVYQINIINGKCDNYEDENIEIRNVFIEDFKKGALNNYKEINDIIIDFNNIFLNSGIFIKVKPDSKIQIKINHKTLKDYTIFQHNIFNFKKNCEVILEDNFNLSENTINNIQHNIDVEEGSNIKHNLFQKFSKTNKLYLTTNTSCAKDSSFIQHSLNFADGFVRNFHEVKLNGEFSKAILKGCFFLKNNNVCSNKTYISHNAENCESDQIYKGILNNNSKANYFSNTFVSKNAQKTEGFQLSKGILLTDNCSFFSKPELRIFADDVKCSHGSTIGPVDESALYYLRSRGINKNEAMKMIISSFIKDDLQNLSETNIDKVNKSLSNYLINI